MVLIYVNQSSPRLQYIAAFVFRDLIKTPYSITTHKQGFKDFAGIKINYSAERISENEVHIHNCGLLDETGIKEQAIHVSEFHNLKIFFRSLSPDDEVPFDIFSACFYLISRYEEYLPHKKDQYGRYFHESSLAYREGFLNVPLINKWVNYFNTFLQNKFPGYKRGETQFLFTPTYDVDMAFSYLHKGFVRNLTGSVVSFAKLKFSDLANRFKVLTGSKKDPFNNFNWLDSFHQQHNLNPIYFFLVAGKNSLYDKNILSGNKAMQRLIVDHSKKYPCGLHPSWQSGDDFRLIKKEKKTLEIISGKTLQEVGNITCVSIYRAVIEH